MEKYFVVANHGAPRNMAYLVVDAEMNIKSAHRSEPEAFANAEAMNLAAARYPTYDRNGKLIYVSIPQSN